MTLTKVRLEWLTKISSRDEIDDIDGDEIRELARVALAALESRADAEPVTYDQVQRDHMKDILIHKMSSNLTSSVPLVMADIHAATMALMQAGFRVRPQPAPVVVDFNKLARELVENLVDCNGADDSAVKQYQKWAEKTCRAAMLQGIDEPISQPYTLPEGYALVPVEPTIAMLDEFDSIIDYGADDSNDAWRRLLAAAWIKSLPAAPKQEAE
ncbi:hypothetical protein [Atlantibacter hermannii]|uniref:hypothetical protein n=1 Tax=Atlantibacter hermannii TaxID=565 RepID=UPI0028A1815D|nr:hypothetical protein [Atlantibacter hermannii]